MLEDNVLSSIINVAIHTGLLSSPSKNFGAHMMSMVSSSSSWVIDSEVTNHMTSMSSNFRSDTLVHGNICVADGNYIQFMGEGSTNVSSNLLVFCVTSTIVCT